MTNSNLKSRLGSVASIAAILAAYSTSASAFQEADAPILIGGEETTQNQSDDEIVVTGSRLRRNTFDSISPLQVIDADVSRLSGLTTAAEFLTQSPVVTGAQLDASVNAGSPTAAVEGVSAGGIGATNVSLRGLGPERTLVLVNGRRVAPSGVRGAPVAPDINLIPNLLIENIELLTDGASSIYGADAVAGVANIILRKDYEGFEIQGQLTAPEEPGGGVRQIGFIAGTSTDRGNVTFSGEYFNRESVLVGDRSEFNECLKDIELTDDGQVVSSCLDARPDNAALILSQGFIFRTPGTSNIGVPGWTTTAGLPENFRTGNTYTLQDEELDTQLLLGVERYSLFTSGNYDIVEGGAHSFYFEASYAQRQSTDRLTDEQVFPGVPGFIPQEDESGNIITGPDNAPILVMNPLNPFGEDALPVYSTTALPQIRDAEVQNMRLVGGFEGDLPIFKDKGWAYDVGLTYDRSYGTATQPIIRENSLRFALDTLRLDSDGNVICGLPRTSVGFGFITPEDCVPVNFFADNLFSVTGGDKSFTEEEEDFLTGRAFNTTEIEQRQVYAYFTGDTFEMPAGAVPLAIGFEYREMEITSLNDIVRQNGLAASEVPDIENDTIGETYLIEAFVETEVPLHETFRVNLSGRFTEEKNFGNEFTYSAKALFDPVDWLSLKATYGTTFRAPNLREQFLAGQAGTIAGTNDPCLVPLDARDGDGNYDPAGDDRDPVLLDNCVQSGADPTALGLQATTGIPTSTGGSTNLQAETSDSLTAGFVFRQTFSDRFDFDLAVTYWSIEIEDTVRESNPASLIAQCFGGEPNLADPACSRVSRNVGNPAQATISNVDAAFINVGQFDTSGIDYVAQFGMGLDEFGEMFENTDFRLSFTGTQVLSLEEQVSPEDPVDELEGTVANPEWRWLATATLSKGPWTGLWRTNYIGEGQQIDSDPFQNPSPTASACGVLGFPGQCRDVDFVQAYMTNDASISYDAERWTATLGVSNLLNETPSLVDQGEAPARMNIPVQAGYDLIGRRVFANLRYAF